MSDADLVAEYQENGFAILRHVFAREEMTRLQSEADRLLKDFEERIHPRNLRCRYMPHHETGIPLFEVFDPVNDLSPLCEQFSRDPRITSVLERLSGEPVCLFKDKLIFKPAGATGYRLHQDIPLGWPGFPQSFVTVLIPIDASSPENGCTQLYRGYHHRHLSDDPGEYMLPDDAVDESRRVDLNLEPGDIAIFHGLTPHRSDPNRSHRTRRSLFTSYNAVSEGGDQRTAHYADFQRKLRERLEFQSPEPVFFR